MHHTRPPVQILPEPVPLTCNASQGTLTTADAVGAAVDSRASAAQRINRMLGHIIGVHDTDHADGRAV